MNIRMPRRTPALTLAMGVGACLVLLAGALSCAGSALHPDDGRFDADSMVGDAQEQPDAGFDDVLADELPPIPADIHFSAPEGIVVRNNKVFVTNANFAYEGGAITYGRGFVTVVDADDAVVTGVVPLPFRNPQDMAFHGDRLWVLCSGETFLNTADSTVVSKTPGGLAGIDLEGIDSAAGPSTAIGIPAEKGSLIGYPSGMAVVGSDAWLASGTTAALFLVNLESGRVVRGASNPVMLADGIRQNTTVVGPGPDGLLTVGLFNDDRIFLFDPVATRIAADPWPAAEIGQKGLMDGILDIESDGFETYVLMGLANQVMAFDSAAGPDGASGVRKLASGLLMPNRMKLFDSRLYVVSSGDNSLSVVDVATGDRDSFGLPVGCNPWDLALEPIEGSVRVWVTCLKSHRVVAVDTVDGSLLEVE